jgi:dihydroxyacetone kinase
VVILNGLGAVKYEELYVLFGYVADHLESHGIEIVEPECGEFVTSLDMAGVSLTILWLDDEIEELWKAPASSPAFRKGIGMDAATAASPRAVPVAESISPPEIPPAGPLATPAAREAAATARGLLRSALQAVAAQADSLGELDAVAGDGDHGIGMVRGLTAAADAADGLDDSAGVRELLQSAGDAWSETAGGTSGALWGAALAELGASLGASLGSADAITARDVVAAVHAASERIAELGGASPGDKTMLDALAPYASVLSDEVERGAPLPAALAAAADAARKGVDATSAMTPRRGRARPLAERSLGHPDPGAMSFWIIADDVARAARAQREVE